MTEPVQPCHRTLQASQCLGGGCGGNIERSTLFATEVQLQSVHSNGSFTKTETSGCLATRGHFNANIR